MPKTKKINQFTRVNMVSVKSSQIKEVGYMEPNTLFIKFNNDKVYSYVPVTQIAFTALVTAESVGKYFNVNIKDNKAIAFTKLN